MRIHKFKAFSLIELLIVIAIVGILGAVALPGYRNYINRAEVSTALAPLPKLKTKVVEYYNESGDFPTSASDIGYKGDEFNSGILESFDIKNGAILFKFEESGKSGFDLLVTYAPGESGGMISWACVAEGETKYAPSTCTAVGSDEGDSSGGSTTDSTPKGHGGNR